MSELKSIEEELADCRAAFAACPQAVAVWCCHHDVLLEYLGSEAEKETSEARIQYMLNFKSEHELACRFRNFRPVRLTVPKDGLEAWDNYAAGSLPEEDEDENDQPLSHREALEQLHNQDWPDNTWNGRNIYGEQD